MKDKCCRKHDKKRTEVAGLKSEFDVLNDENRLRILCLLKKHGEMCVCEIYEALDLPQNLVSYHLGKLKETGFVTAKKEGARIIYRRSRNEIGKFLRLVDGLLS